MKARIREWVRELWYRRPVLVLNHRMTDKFVDTYQAGYQSGHTAGLVESIRGKRATSTGRVLRGLPGGVA